MDAELLYYKRCEVIDQFALDIAVCPSPRLRRDLLRVLLTWQRWASADFHAPNPSITCDWTGPMDYVDPDTERASGFLDMAWNAACKLANLDMEVMSGG